MPAWTMSSGTSTDAVPASSSASAFRAWHLFVLAGLLGAAVAVATVRPQGIAPLILLVAAVAAGAYVGYACYRMVLPLASPSFSDRVEMVGGRTRAALEREKTLVLRAIKELEFDRAMGKVSDADFDEMAGRLRARARMLLKQLDIEGMTYRELIERELTARLGNAGVAAAGRKASAGQRPSPSATRVACGNCDASNERDAKFCKQCGAEL